MKRARGWQQEKAMQDALLSATGQKESEPADIEHSALCTLLLNLWSGGGVSAVAIQKIAHCAILDGASHPELIALAKCGDFGQHQGNVARDVQKTFVAEVSIAPATSVSVPAIDPKTSQETQVEASFFLPHLMFWSLMAFYNTEATIMFALDKIEHFWANVVANGDPKLVDHPILSVPDFMSRFIHLFVHGDGVEYHDRDSMMVYSWGALLSAGSSMDTSLLLAMWPKSCTVKGARDFVGGTWHHILLWLAWSFNALFDGRHPTKDPFGMQFPENSLMESLAGKPLCASGHRCVLWAIEGDQDFFANTLKLPHWKNPMPCWGCDCDTRDAEKTWLSFKPGQQGWIAKAASQARATLLSQHPFFKIHGTTSLMVAQDALHILFCKGVLSHLLGSVLHSMTWSQGPGRQAAPPSDRLASIFSRVQKLYVEFGTSTRLTNLRLSMFTSPDKPHADYAFLNVKGSEAKHLLKPLTVISLQDCKNTDFDRRRAACLVEMNHIVEIMDHADIFLTAEEQSHLEAALLKFLGHYSWLNSFCVRENRYLFHMVIKFHMLHHLVLDAKYLNPRMYWCFKGEDYVGRISTLAHSVSMGVRSTMISQKATAKYRHWLHLKLTRGDYA